VLKEMVAHKVEDNTARDDNVHDDELAKVVNDIVVGIAHSELPGVGRMNRQLVEVANETAAAAAAVQRLDADIVDMAVAFGLGVVHRWGVEGTSLVESHSCIVH
jgi:hypothetical protein